jgi:ATP-dependent DNA helicase DinG
LKIACSPVDVAPRLREHLFNATNSDNQPIGIVLTSATLSTAGTPQRPPRPRKLSAEPAASADTSDNSDDVFDDAPPPVPPVVSGPFGHLINRLGCDTAQTLQLGSPFDYATAVELFVEPTMPDPNDAQFAIALGPRLLDHIRQTQGGAFVLFTSYQLLNRMADWLRPRLIAEGLPMLVHGQDGPRSQLLKRFKQTTNGVLLGTDSFWQGVDVQGQALRNVIITKLPFAVPDRPLIQARIDRIRQRGGNPFFEYQLPEAVIKFKQGFGRLIRSQTDRGRVVVLDKRVLTKPYGHKFINALPPIPLRRVKTTPDDAIPF